MVTASACSGMTEQAVAIASLKCVASSSCSIVYIMVRVFDPHIVL
jgi:hypothetical protein